MEHKEINTPEEFSDICPLADKDFKEKMAILVQDPGFQYFVHFIMPDVDYPSYSQGLLKVNTKNEFQHNFVCQYLEWLVSKTAKGLSAGGLDLLNPQTPYLFITNHRDIVLDAALMNVALSNHGFPTSEVAIGNNLLAFDWITTLVKMNKSFIVKRDTTTKGRLQAAVHLSQYINFAIAQKNDSVWIAQRQGRAKDSNDLTQESLIKMLTLGGDSKDPIECLKKLNIAPASLSYEFDPNDYLKATEFLMKKKDPNFKKSQEDDIISMATGLRGYKGQIHFEFSPCINNELDKIPAELDKQEKLNRVCEIIDKSIHARYRIYPCNYIAYDRLNNTNKFADHYTDEDIAYFNKYLNRRVEKVKVPLNDDDVAYIKEMILTMYANPLINKIKALG